jgi:hypothetical protein
MVRTLAQRFPNNKRIREFPGIARRTIEQKLRTAGVDKVPNLEQSLADLSSLLPQDIRPEGTPAASIPPPG